MEVKGPGDRLSNKQILWLEHLEALGVEAVVCHVEATNGRKKIPTSRQERASKKSLSQEVKNEPQEAGMLITIFSNFLHIYGLVISCDLLSRHFQKPIS